MALPIRVAAKLAVSCIVVVLAVNTAAGFVDDVCAAMEIVQKPVPTVNAQAAPNATFAVPLPEPVALENVFVTVHDVPATVKKTLVGHPAASLYVVVSVYEAPAGLDVVAVDTDVAHVATKDPYVNVMLVADSVTPAPAGWTVIACALAAATARTTRIDRAPTLRALFIVALPFFGQGARRRTTPSVRRSRRSIADRAGFPE
jgi:hypothetical protein